MPGHSPADAFEDFHRHLRVASSCVHREVQWAVGHSKKLGDVVQSTLNHSEPTRLTCQDDRKLGLLSTISVQIIEDPANGPFRVTTRESIHELVDLSVKTEKGDRLVAWHYHPGGPGVVFPHMHLPTSLRADDPFGIAKSHVPTGRVAFEDIAFYLIGELGIVPARADFEKRLTETRDRHRAHQSWH